MEASAGAIASRGETSYSRVCPGPVTKKEQMTIRGEKTKSHVQHCIGCKRTIGCGILSFLPLCITPSNFLSSCTPGFSLHAGVCVYIDIHMPMCTKAITCRMSQDRQSVASPVCQLHSNAGWQHPKWISIWQWSLWNQMMVQPRHTEEQCLHHHICIQS